MVTLHPTLHPRRMYLLLALTSLERGEDAAWRTLRGQQRALTGTAISTSLPGYDKLVAAGYECVEDISGARADELIKAAGLNRREADAVIAAIGS